MKRIFQNAILSLLVLSTLSVVAAVADPAAEITTHGAAMRSAADVPRIAAAKYFQSYATGIKPLVQAMTSALGDKNADVRYYAVRGLAEIGPSARDAVPALIPVLNDISESVRTGAVEALGEIGIASDEVVCGVVFLLQDPSVSVRARAAITLGKFGPAADIHRPALTDMLTDPNVDVGINAALALALTGEPTPDAARLYALALTRDGAMRKVAANALKKIGAPSVEALLALMNDAKDRDVRREAATMLGKLGDVARPAVPALVATLTDPDLDLQNRAAQTLIELDAAPVEASMPLIRLMKDSSEFRVKALLSFEKMNEHATVLPLALMQSKDDVYARREAMRILTRLAPRFKQNPDALLIGLSDADETVRIMTLEALAKSGCAAKPLIAPLSAAMVDTSHDVKNQAVRLLATFHDDPGAVVALAVARLNSKSATVKSESGKAVLAAGAHALPALSVLRAALKSDDTYAREWAVQALINIGPAASDAIPELIESLIRFKTNRAEVAKALGAIGAKAVDPVLTLLTATDPAIRGSAALALGYIGEPALSKVKPRIDDPNPDTAEAAVNALASMAPASAPAIPDLIRVAMSKVIKVQYAAGIALGKMGPLATPALIEELKKPDETVRSVAAITLGYTGKKSVPMLIDALRAEHDPVTISALIYSLARVGPAASESIPAILEIAGRPFQPKDRAAIWSNCASALATIGAARETSVPVLFGMLSAEDKPAHYYASAALRSLGSDDLRVPPLTDALKNGAAAYVGQALRPFGRPGMLQLVAEMEAGTPEIRDAAARAFAYLAPDCVPFLVKTLDDNPASPASAIGVILAIGEVRAVEIERRSVKTVTAKSQEELQKALDACTPSLQKRIQNGTPDEAVAALWALGKRDGIGLEGVVKKFAECSPDLHSRAMPTLSYYDVKGQGRALVPALPILLKDCGIGSVAIRKQKAAWLENAGYYAESAPALADALEDPIITIRTVASAGLKALGAEARGCVPKLVHLLDEGAPNSALCASAALTSIGSPAAPKLFDAINIGIPKFRATAFAILATMKLNAHVGVADLAADDRDDVSVNALRLLGALKEGARPAEAKVRALLARDNDLVFQASVQTLAKMGVNTFAALAPLTENPNADLALRAIKGLQGVLPNDAGTVIEFVKKGMKNENPEVRAALILLLPGKATGTAASMPLMAAALKDPSYMVRVNVAVWLFDNAPFRPDLGIPLLLIGIKDPYVTVNTVSSRALIQMGEKSKAMVPELQKMLAEPALATRTSAARVLIKIGVDDPLAQLIYNESNIAAKVEEYQAKQEQYFEEHFTQENVHHFAAAFLDTWGEAGKEYASKVDADGTFNLTGYRLKVLSRQTARAEGGAKDYVKTGVLVNGHALLAWPAQPGVSGRIAYMSGPDGALYQRAVKADDAPKYAEYAAAFDPGPDWQKTFTPVKNAVRPIPRSYYKDNSQKAEQMEF